MHVDTHVLYTGYTEHRQHHRQTAGAQKHELNAKSSKYVAAFHDSSSLQSHGLEELLDLVFEVTQR